MKTHQLLGIAIFTLLLLLGGCGSGNDKDLAQLAAELPPAAPPAANSFQPPTAKDNYEGVLGDDTPATAAPLPIGGIQVRNNYPVGDVDYAAVTLTGGVTYEFFANKLSPQSDTYMELYDTNGTTVLGSNDDYVGYSSRIQYTPPLDGTYYVKVRPLGTQGYGSYTMGALVFTDADGDFYSPYYDCNDGNPGIFPVASEVPGDGIDQNCTGADGMATVPDPKEPDNTFSQAKPLVLEVAHQYETFLQKITFQQNSRTLDAPGDVDYFSINIPPFAKYQIEGGANNVGTLLITWYQSDGVTPISNSITSFPYITLDNPTPTPTTRYLRVEAWNGTDVGWYAFYMSSYGTDADGDFRYTVDWAGSQDCDDTDPGIYVGAPETGSDGIDSNCNGLDNS